MRIVIAIDKLREVLVDLNKVEFKVYTTIVNLLFFSIKVLNFSTVKLYRQGFEYEKGTERVTPFWFLSMEKINVVSDRIKAFKKILNKPTQYILESTKDRNEQVVNLEYLLKVYHVHGIPYADTGSGYYIKFANEYDYMRGSFIRAYFHDEASAIEFAKKLSKLIAIEEMSDIETLETLRDIVYGDVKLSKELDKAISVHYKV